MRCNQSSCAQTQHRFVFDKPFAAPFDDCPAFTHEENGLVDKIQTWWTNVAASGHPGNDWSPYIASNDNQQHMYMRAPLPFQISQGTHRRADFCDLWDSLYAQTVM